MRFSSFSFCLSMSSTPSIARFSVVKNLFIVVKKSPDDIFSSSPKYKRTFPKFNFVFSAVLRYSFTFSSASLANFCISVISSSSSFESLFASSSAVFITSSSSRRICFRSSCIESIISPSTCETCATSSEIFSKLASFCFTSLTR